MLRLLVVDDEPALLRLLGTCLKRMGHEPVCCPTGTAGLQQLDDPAAEFDVAVLDHWLPDMSGMELLHGVLERRPGIRVLVSSGSLMDVESLQLADTSRVAFLQKPYAPRMLAAALDELLKR